MVCMDKLYVPAVTPPLKIGFRWRIPSANKTDGRKVEHEGDCAVDQIRWASVQGGYQKATTCKGKKEVEEWADMVIGRDVRDTREAVSIGRGRYKEGANAKGRRQVRRHQGLHARQRASV